MLWTITAPTTSAPAAFAACFAMLRLLRIRWAFVVPFDRLLSGLLRTGLGLRLLWTRRLRFGIPLLSGVLRIFAATGLRAPLTAIFATAP
ncbi:MAG: hypothetical protein ACXWCX_15585, partial [Burkholderiales bacterium]